MAKPKVSECSGEKRKYYMGYQLKIYLKKQKQSKNKFLGLVENFTPFPFRHYSASPAVCLIPFCIFTS